MQSEWMVGVFLICIALLSVDILRRVVIEILHIQQNQAAKKVMRRLLKPVQPWVTVILYGDASKLEVTRQSLQKNHYHNYDIVIQGSRAKTYQTVYRKSRHGKIVIALPTGIVVDRNFIKRAVALQQNRRQWKIEVQKPTQGSGSLIEIISRLQAIVWNRPLKAEVFIAAELKKKRLPKLRTFVPLLPAVVSQLGVIGLIVAGSVCVDLVVLWYAWVLISSYLLILVWFNNDTRMTERLSLSFAVPSALFVIPIANSIAGFFQLSSRK